MQMQTLATKVAGDHLDKENRQRLSNRQGMQSCTEAQTLTLKRNKTSEGVYRQSIVNSRSSNPSTIVIQHDKESGHKKSKNSEHDDKMSVGTHRNNS